MRRIAALIACLMLAACIDMELTLDLSDGETVQTRVEMSLARQLYDMLEHGPDGFCPGADSTLGVDQVHCVMTRTRGIDDLLAEGGGLGMGGGLDASRMARLEALPNGDLRITMDLGALQEQNAPPPEDIAAMEPMLRGALAGHSLIFRVIGARITDTTGTLSEDGTTAEYVIPMVSFLDPDPDLDLAFVTDLSRRKGCRFWVFCD